MVWTDSGFTIVVELHSMLSFAVFLGTAWLSTTTTRRRFHEGDTTVTSSVSSGDVDDDDDNDSQDDEKEWYLRRRLQHRLSFSNISEEDERTRPRQASEFDSKADFNPKNTNWQHFEHSNHSFYSITRNRADKRPRPTLGVRTSLAGEASADSFKDDATDDEEFSLTSADHFVWTEAHYTSKHGRMARINPTLRRGNSLQQTEMPETSVPEPRLFPSSAPPARRSLSLPISQPKDSNVARVRANYNARIMPNKVILMRHGQSLGNIDETLYSTTPDNAIPLTNLGWEQARAAGRRLKYDILPQNCNIHFIVSPYVRTVETFHGMLSAWCDPHEFDNIPDRHERIKAWYSKLLDMGITWAEDPRIREQDFGNLQNPEQILQSKRDRHSFGAFYYRFANGESAADVFDRISTFLDSLWRSFDANKSQYFVIVTHGIAVRVLLSRYFRYTIDQFHLLSNPRNCEMIELEHDGEGRLQLAGRHELSTQVAEETGELKVLGYHYHKRLRVLPSAYVRKVKVRVSPDDEYQ